MELTGKLKEEVEKAKSKEEIKDAFEKAGLSLSDDELDNVSGGVGLGNSDKRPSCFMLPQKPTPPCPDPIAEQKHQAMIEKYQNMRH